MRPTFIVFCLFFILSGCSASKTAFVYKDQAGASNKVKDASTVDDNAWEDKPGTPIKRQNANTDTSRPATFDDYRQWRKANDPSGQTYAEYKEWEAAYKQWSKDQVKAATQ